MKIMQMFESASRKIISEVLGIGESVLMPRSIYEEFIENLFWAEEEFGEIDIFLFKVLNEQPKDVLQPEWKYDATYNRYDAERWISNVSVGMTFETAKQGTSKCRNASIAEAFQYMHIVESWETGIPRIISKCKAYDLPEPIFEEFGSGVKVTLLRKVGNAGEKVGNGEEKVGNAGEKVGNGEKKVGNGEEKVGNAHEKQVNAFEKYRLRLEQSDITNTFIDNIEKVHLCCESKVIFGQADVIEWLGCSKAKATNVMNAMKAAEVIEKVKGFGPGKYKFIEL